MTRIFKCLVIILIGISVTVGCSISRSARPRGNAIGVGTGERGIASVYSAELTGKPTASGEPYDPAVRTAAHKSLPFGTRLKVINAANGLSTIVRVNDRGPFVQGRVIDLSAKAASDLAMTGNGTQKVQLILQ